MDQFTGSTFRHLGGSLRPNDPTYVERSADQELYQELKQGHFCYVFNSRQMGKSSLAVRVRQQLETDGIICVPVDLSLMGSQVTPEQWYTGIAYRIMRRFQLSWHSWWAEHESLSPVQRLGEMLQEVLLPNIDEPIVIFIDEIDSVLSFQFPTDDLFALIRACCNERGDDPTYDRLTFCLLGVASPSKLIVDKERTPFNLGHAVDLTGFQLAQALGPLTPGLAPGVDHTDQVLAEILEWTGGQPFLTQKLCHLVVKHGGRVPNLANIVQTYVLENWEAQDEPEHLRTIRDRVLHNERNAGRLLGLYQQVLQAGQIADDGSSELLELRLTGLAVKHQNALRSHNRIYGALFNLDWVERQLTKLRPYSTGLAAWIATDQDASHLLRGEALQEARRWAADKNLPAVDYRYLEASQEFESNQLLQAEVKAKQILGNAHQQAQGQIMRSNQRLRLASIGLCAAGAIVMGSFVYANARIQQTRLANREKAQAQQEQRVAENKANQALQRANLAEKEQQSANATTRKARENLRLAQRNLRRATHQVELAEQRISQTELQVQQLNQAKTQTEQAKLLAEQAKSRAQHGLTVARAGLKKANAEFRKVSAERQQVEANLKIARAGAQLEQLGAAARTQFQTNQSGALLSALLAGQALQDLIDQRSEAPDARLVNNKLALEDYPALGPRGALQEILFNIQERFFDHHHGSVWSVGWSSDGQTLATVGENGTVKLWNQKGQPIESIQTHHGRVTSISWSSDGQTLATVGENGTVKLWNQKGQPIESIQTNHGRVTSISWSSDGQTLATGGPVDGTVKLWNQKGQPIESIQTHHGRVTSISWSSDGQTLATVGENGTVKLWNQKGQPIESIQTNHGRVTSISWSSDGQTLATVGENGTVKLWNQKGQPIESIQTNHGSVTRVSWSSDGQTLATGGLGDGTVKLWNQKGQPIESIQTNQGSVLSFSWSSDGQTLATAGENGTVKLWNQKGQPIESIQIHQSVVTSVSWSSDGQTLATVGVNGTVKLLNQKGQPIESIQTHQGSVSSVSWSSDGQTLATAGENSTVKLWNQKGQPIESIQTHQGSVLSFSWSSDGQTLATAGENGTVKLLNQKGQPIESIQTHQGSVSSVSWSSDGQTLATAGLFWWHCQIVESEGAAH
ncbi:AAA-like domain-containing protein (plasmid) [Acaryochloris sp. 'Moss Beach']|uniref:WD40 domain-containing protein n=1 Tax=Acaryochloris sp. 'Moss Beach' TaxID=2740837 RepID=UPI001F4074B3|nr:AAA-like domain-containing protein [Acaryochloris sp. 'Moss Beach']UJB72978.1 AAA-like domain-containing protein [Acaryochloris sp. 'Moss Beach']